MLLLFLFASFFGPEGTLLCFGNDGHVAIEFVDACNGESAGSRLEGMENDACGPCKDVQFISATAHTNNAPRYVQTFPLISASPVLSSSNHAEYFSRLLIPQVSSHHKTLSSLHSVILLI